MPYRYDLPPTTVLEALQLMGAEDLKRMQLVLSVPKPRPTRKAEIAKAIDGCLRGESLRTLWGKLNEHQQLAVRETLHGFDGEFNPEQFNAKYGKLPAGCGGSPSSQSSPIHFFLYPAHRHAQTPSIVPPDLAKRLKDFVPPPPEPKLSPVEELPDAIQQRRRGYVPSGEKPGFDSVELVRRDMEQAAARDLLAVLRLVEQARVAELHGSKLALTKRGRAALAEAPAKTLRYLWERWRKNTLLDEFSRVDAIKG